MDERSTGVCVLSSEQKKAIKTCLVEEVWDDVPLLRAENPGHFVTMSGITNIVFGAMGIKTGHERTKHWSAVISHILLCYQRREENLLRIYTKRVFGKQMLCGIVYKKRVWVTNHS